MTARALVALLIALLIVAGCGSSGAPTQPPPAASDSASGYPGWPPSATFELIPVPVSTELVVGSNRLLINVIDSANESIAQPNTKVNLALYDLAADAGRPAFTADTAFLETFAGRPGLYRAQVTFDRPGDWGLEAVAFEADGSQRSGRMIFSVRESGSTPPIGGEAPSSDTPTATTAQEIAAIATDDDPDPDFYRQSIAGALAAKEPFAVVFATPAFCTSVACGPTLDLVKSVAAAYKGRMTFINVEPYQLKLVDGHLQPELSAENLPIPVPAVNDWGLPTEPYIFVVDSQGIVTAKFEGIASAEELDAAFSAVASPL